MDLKEQAVTAQRLLKMRALRWDYFRGDIFDEHGWNALLILFIAEAQGRSMTGVDVAGACGAPANVGARWMTHLAAEKLVLEDRGVVALTDTTRAELAEYLTEVANLFGDPPRAVEGENIANA